MGVDNSSPWRNSLARLTVMHQVDQEVGSSSLPGDGEHNFQLFFLLLVVFHFLVGKNTGASFCMATAGVTIALLCTGRGRDTL